MLTDLLINEKGDIVITNETSSDKMELNFFITKSKALKLTFHTERRNRYLYSEHSNKFILRFSINEKRNTGKALLIGENDFLKQQIFIRLKTSLGEIKARNFIGSKIETLRHKDIMDNNVIQKLKDYITESLYDLISNKINISIQPFAKLTTSGYKQCINIVITIDNDDTIEYIMEW